MGIFSDDHSPPIFKGNDGMWGSPLEILCGLKASFEKCVKILDPLADEAIFKIVVKKKNGFLLLYQRVRRGDRDLSKHRV